MNHHAAVFAGTVLWALIREISRRKTLSVYEIKLRNEASGEPVALFTGTGFRVR